MRLDVLGRACDDRGMSVRKRTAASVLAGALLTLPAVALALRIGDCPGGRFATELSTTVGLPFEDGSSASGSLTVADGAIITLGACPGTPAPLATVRRRHFWRARWDSCGPFENVRLRLQLGPGGGGCGYVIGVIRYREPSGRRRAIKFPADLVGP